MSLRSLLLFFALALAGVAQTYPAVSGSVRDVLGRAVAGATVAALDAHGTVLAQAQTDDLGDYTLTPPEGSVQFRASHQGLADAFLPLTPHPSPLVLGLAAVQETVNVTAVGVPVPAAQLGNTVSSIPGAELEALNPLQADAALRLQPGLAVIASGQTGAETSIFMRGAPSEFTKVLLDGVPIQRLDVGGYDFSNLSPVGLDEIQILRGPDSVIYGSDAAAGVISLRTSSGADVAAPEFDNTTEFGAYGTAIQNNQLLGNWSRFDYAFRYGYLDTHNQLPNSGFRNNTYGADLGWRAHTGASLRVQVQRNYSGTGEPGEPAFTGFIDGSFKHQGETYDAATWRQQLTPQWSQRLQFTQAQSNLFSEDPAPVGIPDGFGDSDGLPVTIVGANGFGASGQAITSFGGSFPQVSVADTLRRDISWESDFTLSPAWSLIEGYRYYDETGGGGTISRHDNGVYAALTGGLWNRLFGNGGVSFDRNTPFGTTANPQASLAWFPRLARGRFWDETRLRAGAGTALKDPQIVDQQFSLYQELFEVPAGRALISQFGLAPLRPERSHDFDAGVDQYFGGGAGMLSLTIFEQHYYDLIEDIPTTAFPALGIPAAVATVADFGGEFNSLDQRARGVELDGRLRLGASGWRLDGSYTATAATVLRSFSFDAQAPTINPDFPDIPIGAFAPLVGARPFRVPPQTASGELGYGHGPFAGLASIYYVSRRDDSTFLTDSNFGNTLMLPNRNLDPAFTIANLSGTWSISPRWSVLAAVDNVFNSSYQEVIGFPGPKITARLGVRWTWRPPLR